MAFWAAAAPVLGSVLGGLMGQGAGNQSQNVTRSVAPAGADELYAGQASMDVLRQLQGFAQAGPGQQDISNAYGAQNDLAAMLQQFAQGGYAPTEADQLTARTQLAPQFEQARQSQIQAGQAYRQQAAISGRGPMDFATTNKMNQNFGNQMSMLAAQQSQLAAQQPMQRLGFMQDFANLKQGLASQALQNRLAIANLGSSIKNTEQQFRSGTAGSSMTGSSGSQQGNMLMGALSGLGTGLSLYNKFNGSSGSGQATASAWDGIQSSPNLASLINSQGNAGSSYGTSGRGVASNAAPMAAPAASWSSNYGSSGFPAFAQGSSPFGTQVFGTGLPQFMQPAFNVYNPIK